MKEKHVFIILNLIKPPKNEEYLYPININRVTTLDRNQRGINTILE